MPISCFNCSATNKLHGLPNKKMQQKWLEVIPNLQKGSFNKNFRLCSAHFADEYLTWSGRLFWNAVPSKFYIDGSWITITEFKRTRKRKTKKQPIVTDHFEITSSGDLDIIPSETNNETETIVPQPKEFRYVGDINTSVLYSPKTSRRALYICKTEIEKHNKQIMYLSNEIERAKNDLNVLNTFLDQIQASTLPKGRPNTLIEYNKDLN